MNFITKLFNWDISTRYFSNIRLRIIFKIWRENRKKATLSPNYNKIFCIGFNKTATTSVETAFSEMGFKVGSHKLAAMLTEEVCDGRYDRLINFCKTSDAFQDEPFSLPDIYKVLDKNFPNSKFILTIRDNEEQWYNSLCKFHTKLLSEDKTRLPNERELESWQYIYEGYLFMSHKKRFPCKKLYDKNFYQAIYLKHIQDVKNYFSDRAE